MDCEETYDGEICRVNKRFKIINAKEDVMIIIAHSLNQRLTKRELQIFYS